MANSAITVTGTAAVNSVNGTTNRVTSTGGANPVIDISASYVGQASITTVGALASGSITTGFTTIDMPYGGTNAALTANNGGIIYSTASAMAVLAGTATAGQIIRSGATAAPTWSTTTYPATNAINTLLYASAANVMSALTTGNNGVLITSGTGVPSISSTLPNATQDNITRLGTIANTTQPIGVTFGGTGESGFTAYAILTAGTTGTGAFNNIAGTAANTKWALISQGASVPAVYTNIPGANRVVNGDFQVWQRGTSIAVPASTTIYTADRWQVSTGASQACTVSQQFGPVITTMFGQVQRNAGQTGTSVIRFCTSLTIDMCGFLNSQILTLSFNAKCGANFSAGSSIMTTKVYSGTGTTDISGINGAFVGSAQVISQSTTLTTSSVAFSYTTAAVGACTQFAIEFSYTPVGTAGANDWFSVSFVQLEKGVAATPLQPATFAQQLNACKEFYQKSFAYGTVPAQNVGTGTGEIYFPATIAAATVNASPSFILPVTMHASPTVTLFNPAAANAQIRDETAAADFTASSAVVSPSSVAFKGTGAVGTLVGDICGVHYTAEAELV